MLVDIIAGTTVTTKYFCRYSVASEVQVAITVKALLFIQVNICCDCNLAFFIHIRLSSLLRLLCASAIDVGSVSVFCRVSPC